MAFYCSYIKSRLSYGIEVCSSASASLLSTLEVIPNHVFEYCEILGRETLIPNLQLDAVTSSLQAFFHIINLIILKSAGFSFLSWEMPSFVVSYCI